MSMNTDKNGPVGGNTDSGSKRGVQCRDITILYIAFWQRISLYIIQH